MNCRPGRQCLPRSVSAAGNEWSWEPLEHGGERWVDVSYSRLPGQGGQNRRVMSPRRQLPFKHIPYRQHGYGTAAACELLAARGYPISTWMLRAAADSGQVDVFRSPGGHRRFMGEALEQFLLIKI